MRSFFSQYLREGLIPLPFLTVGGPLLVVIQWWCHHLCSDSASVLGRRCVPGLMRDRDRHWHLQMFSIHLQSYEFVCCPCLSVSCVEAGCPCSSPLGSVEIGTRFRMDCFPLSHVLNVFRSVRDPTVPFGPWDMYLHKIISVCTS